VRKRQKVKTYFLPVQSAKKVRQSLPFFGERQRNTKAGLTCRCFCHGLKARLPAFKLEPVRQKVVVVF
jgi:hypothetical protein